MFTLCLWVRSIFIFTNPELLPVSFLLSLPHTVHIFSEAGISVDEGARGAILALVVRLTDGVGTDSSRSGSSVVSK